MNHIKKFHEINEKEGPISGTNTDIKNIEKMANAQKYAFIKTEKDGRAFDLKIDGKEYVATLYANGRYGIFTGSSELAKGDWYASKWGVSFDYVKEYWYSKEDVGSAGTGLNAIDLPISDGILKKLEKVGSSTTCFIKDTSGKWVPIIAPYNPSSVCIQPKNINDIKTNKCILTKGSKGDVVKLVQSALNFVLSSEALDILKGTGFYNPKGLDTITDMEIDPDGSFGDLTSDAVKMFQRCNGGLKEDGIVGKNTINLLEKAKEEIRKAEIKELEEDIKKSSEEEKVEIEKLPLKKAEEIKVEYKEIDTLKPLDIEIETDKTLKKLRKIRKKERGSRRERRLLRRLARLRRREEKVKTKIANLKESQLNFIEDFDHFNF